MTTDADVIARLTAAMNRHDLAAFVDCFDPDYESEQPAHPDRHFRGRAQVEKNWTAMFAGMPDFQSEVLRSSINGDTHWMGCRWTGTRGDGTRLDARGTAIFGVRGGRLRGGGFTWRTCRPGRVSRRRWRRSPAARLQSGGRRAIHLTRSRRLVLTRRFAADPVKIRREERHGG